MRYSVRVRKVSDREFIAQTVGKPDCRADGKTREEALENIKGEIRYRVEYCPCSWVPDDYVQLDVME
jgi:predicted RNase H-like HicB family nuclease